MKDSFVKRLQSTVEKYNNPSLLGLDPKLEYIPNSVIRNNEAEGLAGPELVAKSFFDFNREILEQLSDLVGLVKFQSACYEQYGHFGMATLELSIKYAKELGFLTILDAKRNDIGSSAAAYANASIGKSVLQNGFYTAIDADSITVNPYLGWDGILPFLEVAKNEGKGVFILVRTSNPSAGDIQDLVLDDGRKVYEAVADKVAEWGKELISDGSFSSVGAVVGATWPDQAKELRERMPEQIFLVPGYGAQGGSAKDAVAGFVNGQGGIVNASRSLMLAWKDSSREEDKFAVATREKALFMKNDLLEAIAGE